MNHGTYSVSKEQLRQERDTRKQLIANQQFDAPEIKKLPVLDAIKSITDSRMQMLVRDVVAKAVESYDLTGIRFVSMQDQVAELANDETVFRNIVEANGVVRSTDFQIRWRENYANANATVEFFNLNSGLPSEAEMARAVRGNTMGAYGNQLNIPFITSELASQSPIASTDERLEQLRMQLIRMRRFSNQKLLSNSEVVSEVVGDTPQWGGFLTRSTSNATVLGAPTDLTNALIQAQVNAIANASSVQGMGYHIPLVCLTTAAQIAVIRDLMIDRFPGEQSNNYLDYQAQLERILPGVKLAPDMFKMYQPDPGRGVAFINEPQLASGTALFFDPKQPRIAKFQMMGQMGPWVLERPVPQLTTLLAVFDFESIIDPLVVSRASYQGLN